MRGAAAFSQAPDATPERLQNAKRIVVLIRVNSIRQLFSSLDPSPFHDRDLDANAAAFIVDWVRQEHDDAEVDIEIILPQEAFEETAERDVGEAIRNFFNARAESARRELDELFSMGRRYLAFGVCVLLACLISSQAIAGLPGDGAWKRVIEESLIILGWVANWKPVETFLYDWQPIVRRRRLFARLSRANVGLTAARQAGAASESERPI